jgi:hypothetical protein
LLHPFPRSRQIVLAPVIRARGGLSMVRHLLLGAGLLISSVTFAQGSPDARTDSALLWSFIDASGSHYVVERRELSAAIPSGSVTVWVRGEHSQDRTLPYRISVRRITFDCAGSYQVTAFSSRMPNGSLRDDWDRFGTARAVEAGTMPQSLEGVLCKER